MRRRIALISVIAALAMAIPVVVFASHQFNDVPGSHTFHNDIDWLANEGITRGCNPPNNTEFCPDDAVTRGAMAAFMKRFHDRFIAGGVGAVGLGSAFRSLSDPPSAGNGVVGGLSMNLQIPEFGLLMVEGSVGVENTSALDAFGCGINTGGAVSLARGDSWRTIDLTVSSADTCSTTTGFLVSPGNQVVRVVISEALGSTLSRAGRLTAVLYTGDDTYGLLENGSEDQVEMRQLSDAPKS